MEQAARNHLILVLLLAMSLLFTVVFVFSCNESHDDDSDDNDGDDDDTTPDDDTTDDDTSVDDDTTFSDIGPILSDGYFAPDPAELREYNVGEMWWYTALYLEVCDPDNDLLPDGQVWIDQIPASIDPWDPFAWSDFIPIDGGNLADAGDCAHPVTAYLSLWVDSQTQPPPPGEYCNTIKAGDNAGHSSYELSPVCFVVEAI